VSETRVSIHTPRPRLDLLARFRLAKHTRVAVGATISSVFDSRQGSHYNRIKTSQGFGIALAMLRCLQQVASFLVVRGFFPHASIRLQSVRASVTICEMWATDGGRNRRRRDIDFLICPSYILYTLASHSFTHIHSLTTDAHTHTRTQQQTGGRRRVWEASQYFL
jgi:hypothetical protein